MLGSRLVLGINLLSLHPDGRGKHPARQAHRIYGTSHPRLIVFEHHFGDNQAIKDVTLGSSLHDVMHKLHSGHRSDPKYALYKHEQKGDTKRDRKGKHGLGRHHGGNGSGHGQHGVAHRASASDQLSQTKIDDLGPILKTPNQPLPWKWWHQCWNDRVHNCSPQLATIERDLTEHLGPALQEHYRQLALTLAARPEVRSLAKLTKIMSGQSMVDDAMEGIPFNYYVALEMSLGMGFTPARSTDMAKRTVDVSLFIPTGISQLSTHVVPIARLGLHRLLGSLLDLGNIRFSHDSAELQNLLGEARHQPLSLAVILKRIIDPALRGAVAIHCPDCNPLATAIRLLLAVKPVAPVAPLCAPNGAQPVMAMAVPLLSARSKHLQRVEQVMLARAFLYLVFDVPFFATVCPQCANKHAVPHADAQILVNAMLECYCSPHSRFHITNS